MAETNLQISFDAVARILWRTKSVIIVITVLGTLIGTGISYLLPKYYRSTAVVLPPNSDQGLASGLSNIASLVGVSLNEKPLSELLPSIVVSEAVLSEVIYHRFYSEGHEKQITLLEYWELNEDSAALNYEKALILFRENLEVNFDRRTNIITFSILMKEPQLAADVINVTTASLDKFLRLRRISNATEQRKWIESRITEVKTDLKMSEDALKEFREKNRRIDGSPQLRLEQQRMLRDVEINSALFIELKKQLEFAKIEEIKNVPIVTIMDSARPAAKKEKPKRWLFLVFSFFASLVSISAFMVISKLYWNDIKNYLRSITDL